MPDPENPLHSIMPILLRFPADSAAIRRLVIEDEGFRCLAEDYLLALNALQSFKNKKPPDRETAEEYSSILLDLEEDIRHFLISTRGGLS
jgi:hypothetical protein